MKVLTIRQPWASLIMNGYKKFEFRSWSTKYRGAILIHAGKNVDKEAMLRLKKYLPEEIPTGKIIGKVYSGQIICTYHNNINLNTIG